MQQIIPVVLVVVFWALAFVFAFWFSTRALSAPIEYEDEQHDEAQTPAHAAH